MEQMLAYYQQHGAITEPGPYIGYLRPLPSDVAQLVEIVGGIFAHYQRDLQDAGWHLPDERRLEVDYRDIRRILGRIVELDSRPLAIPRPLPARFMGTCRDAAVLLCTMLRTQGIPARVRYGFNHFLMRKDKPLADHVLVEYWSAAEGRWKYCDSRLYRSLREKHHIQGVDPVDIPADDFVTGGQAWLMARRDARAAFRLSGFKFDATYGFWRARNLFMYDLASLGRCEPLMWDAWGYMLHTRPEVRPRGFFQYRRLDRLARLDPRQPQDWQELLETCRRHRQLRVPGEVKACSPVNGDHLVSLPSQEAATDAIY